MKTKKTGINLTKLFLYIFFVIAVILPLIEMFRTMAGTDIKKFISSERFISSLKNSLKAASAATVISVGFASLLAWCVERSGIRGRGIWITLFTVPMLIPSISHGMGLIISFGTNGFITRLFNSQGNIYGFSGIIAGSFMYSFPAAFLMISDVLRYEDSTPYEAASVLGISGPRRFAAITVPYMRKSMISVIFAVFTMIITDYGVPLMVGGQYTTLPVVMYQDVIGMLDFGKGSIIGLVLLFPAFLAFILDILNKDKGNMTFTIKPFEKNRGKLRKVIAYTVSSLTAAAIAVPAVSFVLLSFIKKYPSSMTFSLDNIARAFSLNAGTFLINSVITALIVAVTGTLLAAAAAYITARTGGRTSKILHLLSVTSLAVPGIVLGLAYVLFFKSTFIYGTMAVLVLVNIIHFVASPYLMMYNTFSKLNENLEAVGATLGVSRASIIARVLIPQSKHTLAEMFSYFFVNSMMTISAVSFLATVSTRPLSLMITMFEATMLLECAAFVSLLILTANLIIKGIAGLYKRRLVKKS